MSEWKCPNCGAPYEGHGRGECKDRLVAGQRCGGLCCDSDDHPGNMSHGTTFADPCSDARCYHCGWRGTMPQVPKSALAWERRALAAGWKPPKGWGATKNGGKAK